ELGLHGGRREVVGDLQLDRAKAGRGRRREPLDQRALGEEISQIGGKAWHEEGPRGRRWYTSLALLDTREIRPVTNPCACGEPGGSLSPLLRGEGWGEGHFSA